MMVEFRPLDESDLETICYHRRAMFTESGNPAAVLDRADEPFRYWLKDHLSKGTYFGYMAEESEGVIGGVGLMLVDWPPHPSHPEQGIRGYVLNVFVEPSYRKQGLAKRMMAMAEDDFRRRGATYAILHPTAVGRSLYESLGWSASKEMFKILD